MKAKDLITKDLTEGDQTSSGPGGPDRSQRPRRAQGGPPEDFPDMSQAGGGGRHAMNRAMGREGQENEPPGQFNRKEKDMLKDIMMLMLAGVMRSQMDTAIAMKIINGEPLDPGDMAHIVDETSNNVKNLPESHGVLMQKLYELSRSK